MEKPITLSHFSKHGVDCVKIRFAYNREYTNIIREFKFVRWSQGINCWYFNNEKDNLEIFKKRFENIVPINYITTEQEEESIKIEEKVFIMNDPFSDYSSLFISYSFIDKIFVNRLNNVLTSLGIHTFLWEKDAPIGQPLKEIMFEYVNKYDRLLFVASENSLKSRACHYELTQGREKQDKSWKTIIFPIHIDNFLFEVRKENIRPIEKREEYWLNIMELREINSSNFIEFNAENIEISEFEERVKILVKDLKK